MGYGSGSNWANREEFGPCIHRSRPNREAHLRPGGLGSLGGKSRARAPQPTGPRAHREGRDPEYLSNFRKVGRQCIFHFKISASRDDWLRFFFYPFSFACILGMEHVQPWEPGRDWKSNMIGQIHMHRVACRMEVSNFKLVFLSIVSSNFNSV